MQAGIFVNDMRYRPVVDCGFDHGFDHSYLRHVVDRNPHNFDYRRDDYHSESDDCCDHHYLQPDHDTLKPANWRRFWGRL
jgi:hypothetical protein